MFSLLLKIRNSKQFFVCFQFPSQIKFWEQFLFSVHIKLPNKFFSFKNIKLFLKTENKEKKQLPNIPHSELGYPFILECLHHLHSSEPPFFSSLSLCKFQFLVLHSICFIKNIYIYIHTHTHTHTHIYIYIYFGLVLSLQKIQFNLSYLALFCRSIIDLLCKGRLHIQGNCYRYYFITFLSLKFL